MSIQKKQKLNFFKIPMKIFFIVFIISSTALFCGQADSGQAPASQMQAGQIADSRGFQYYKENIIPILEKSCSAKDEHGNYICHGSDMVKVRKTNEEYAKYHDDPKEQFPYCQTCHTAPGRKFSLPMNDSGKIATPLQQMLSYQEIRKRALHNKAPFAKVLRMPLKAQAGGLGLYHFGGEIFEGSSDPDYRALVKWVNIENSDMPDGKPATQSAAEAYFAEKVLPVYARNSCFSASCHIFNHSAFIPDHGTESDNLNVPIAERFTPEQVKFNRMTSKGLIQHIVYLTGDVEQSRLLMKNIPIEKGGIFHRGGNDQFFKDADDPDYKIIKQWLTLEREEAVSKLKTCGKAIDPEKVGKVRGYVFVRTNTDNHRHYLNVGKFLHGGDLYLLKLKEGETPESAQEKAINLTAPFHTGIEVDIREPDVRYDGKAIIFAMRMGGNDNMNIYEIFLDDDLNYIEGSIRRLTYGPKEVNGIKIHYTDPTYVPDPDDQNAASGGYNLDKVNVVFASNLAGHMIPSTKRGLLGQAGAGTLDTIIDYDRPEVDGSFVGRRIYIVDGTNKGEWRTITEFKNRLFTEKKETYIKVDKPFSKDIDETSIYLIERTPETQPGFLPSYSMYGMKYPEKSKEEEIYNATISRITFGIAQELDLSVRSTGEVFFAGQRSFTDKYDRPVFHMTSCRRHLDTRFSFPTHRGNRGKIPIYADIHEMPNGIDIIVGMDPDNLWEGGNLIMADHQLGPGVDVRNPNDFTSGLFNKDGSLKSGEMEICNTKYKFKGKRQSAHPRLTLTSMEMFPHAGPDAVSITGFSPGGIFRDPVPMPNGDILVSYSSKPLNHLDPNAKPDFDLYVLKPDPSFHAPVMMPGYPKVKKLKLNAGSEKGKSEIQAQPIYVRMKQKINAAKRPKHERLIRYPGMPDNDHRAAFYLERNYLLIDAIMDDPSTIGKNVAYKTNPLTDEKTAAADEVKYVRMVEVLPPDSDQTVDRNKIKNHDPESTRISNGIHLVKRIVCEAPLEKDGSIFIQVPSKTPIVMQSLNADKMALRQSARMYFFAPNERFTISPSPDETFQTCGACMGSLAGKADKLFGRFQSFSGQAAVDAIAKTKGSSPPAYGIEVNERIAIDFSKDIQPILDRNCTSCHSGKNAAAGLSLSGAKTEYYSEAYENLMQLEEPASGAYFRKKYVDERNALAIRSYLIEKIYGRELKADRQLTGDAPHPSKKLLAQHNVKSGSLSDAERMTLVRWIDMGAAFQGAE